MPVILPMSVDHHTDLSDAFTASTKALNFNIHNANFLLKGHLMTVNIYLKTINT